MAIYQTRDLIKARGGMRAGHKYKSRRADGKGGYIYEYADDVHAAKKTPAISAEHAQRARQLGEAAFNAGKMAIARQDATFQNELVSEYKGNTKAFIALYDEWGAGWHRANSAGTFVPEDERKPAVHASAAKPTAKPVPEWAKEPPRAKPIEVIRATEDSEVRIFDNGPRGYSSMLHDTDLGFTVGGTIQHKTLEAARAYAHAMVAKIKAADGPAAKPAVQASAAKASLPVPAKIERAAVEYGPDSNYEEVAAPLAASVGLKTRHASVGHDSTGKTVYGTDYTVGVGLYELKDALGKNPPQEKVDRMIDVCAEFVAREMKGMKDPPSAEDIRQEIHADAVSLAANRLVSMPIKLISAAMSAARHTDERDEQQQSINALTMLAHVFGKVAKSDMRFPRLTILRKSATAHVPAGFFPIPGSKKGGYHKQTADGWDYWYPDMGRSPSAAHDAVHEAAVLTEADFVAGRYDKTPAYWDYVRREGGGITIDPWTRGGIDPKSKHPVKIAGQPAKLYEIVDPDADAGWASLRDVNAPANIDPVLVKHDRIYPVEHGMPKKAAPGVRGPDITVGGGSKRTTGWRGGAGEKTPVYEGSTAKPGTVLHGAENGAYPRKLRVLYRADADGVSHAVEDEVLAMPDADKVRLLSELGSTIKSVAKRAAAKVGVRLTNESREDMQSAAMEGALHAIDDYTGGYSLRAAIITVGSQYARLHGAREFAGGVSLPKRVTRMLPGFLAARGAANREGGGGDVSEDAIARVWNVKKRDMHDGLQTGRDDDIPLHRYSLKAGEIVSGKDYPGKIELARELAEFIDGQRKSTGSDWFGGTADVLPGAGVGVGMSEHDRIQVRHDIEFALHSVQKMHVAIGRMEYRLDGAELLRRRLGLGTDPQSTRAIAEDLEVHRLGSDGELRKLSSRAAYDVLDHATEEALGIVRTALRGREEAETTVSRAQDRLRIPMEVVRGGLTVRQRIEADSRKVTTADVREWRARERMRFRTLLDRAGSDTHKAEYAREQWRRVSQIGRREAARHIAEERVMQQPRSREWFANATGVVTDVTGAQGRYAPMQMIMTDLHTGRNRLVNVRTTRDLRNAVGSTFKSDAGTDMVAPDMYVLDLIEKFPRLSQVMWGSDDALALAPTEARSDVLKLMGL